MRFGISTLIFLTVVVAVIMSLAVSDGLWRFGFSMIVGVNCLGLFAAWLVTKVLKFPTDGGYRNPEIRREMEEERK